MISRISYKSKNNQWWEHQARRHAAFCVFTNRNTGILPIRKSGFLLAVAFLIQAFSVCYAASDNGRQRLLMDFGWRFSLTDTAGADKVSFDDSKWRVLNLPHDWSIENAFVQNAPTGGGGGYLPTGIGWYRRHFFLPKSSVSKNVWIVFDGVYQNSDVWI